MCSFTGIESGAGVLTDQRLRESRLYRIHLPRQAAAKLDRDRDLGHKFVMAHLPANLGDKPRASSATLWRLDHGADHLDVLTREELTGRVGEAITLADPGQQVTLRAVLETVCQMATPIDPEVKRILSSQGIKWETPRSRVADDDLDAWIKALFMRRGWEVTDIVRTERRRVSRRRAAMHLVDAQVRAVVTDPVPANLALIHGIGKGRSYGAGMVTVVTQ